MSEIAEGHWNDYKEYYICLSESHPYHYSVLESADALCNHCKQPGSISYYYIGLRSRVSHWCSDRDMCRKMTAHWENKNNWIGEEHKLGWGTNLKQELWDGIRFAGLAYFWDPNKVLPANVYCMLTFSYPSVSKVLYYLVFQEWMLSVQCPTIGCGTVLSSADIIRSPESDDSTGHEKTVTCPNCYTNFNHKPKTVRGDPRNIAYIGKKS